MSYPFPFFGAGIAAYFEWCEVYILFKGEPGKTAQRKICSLAPSPIKPDLTCFDGRLLVAKSDQYVNKYIHKAYDKNSKIPKGESRNFYVSEKAAALFEEEIETWLIEVHRLWPIEIAYRPVAAEAGGTRLSPWHHESIQYAINVQEQWLASKPSSNYSIFAQALLRFAGGLINAKRKDNLQRTFALKQWASEKIANKEYEALAEQVSVSDAGQIREIAEGIESFLSHTGSIVTVDRSSFKLFISLALHPLFPNDYLQEKILALTAILVLSSKDGSAVPALRRLILSSLQYKRIVDYILFYVNQYLINYKKWREAIETYEFAIKLMEQKEYQPNDFSMFCNAAAILQENFSGVKIDEQRKRKILKTCLNYAIKNPPIWLNAGTVYVELRDFKKAYDCFSKYFESGDPGGKQFYEDLHNETIYREFTEHNTGHKLLSIFKPLP